MHLLFGFAFTLHISWDWQGSHVVGPNSQYLTKQSTRYLGKIVHPLPLTSQARNNYMCKLRMCHWVADRHCLAHFLRSMGRLERKDLGKLGQPLGHKRELRAEHSTLLPSNDKSTGCRCWASVHTSSQKTRLSTDLQLHKDWGNLLGSRLKTSCEYSFYLHKFLTGTVESRVR